MTEEKNQPTNEDQPEELSYDKTKTYSPEEAVKLAKEMSKEKFDPSVEVHFNLGINPKKGEEQVRSTVNLPHGSGKTIRIAAFVSEDKIDDVKKAGADMVGGEDLVEEISKSKKTDFDLAVAEPAMMRHLGKIAKILGTRGLMPSPKTDTVTDDPAKAVKELKAGKVSFRNDNTGNLHIVIGKLSFDEKKLLENFKALLDEVRKNRPAGTKGVFIKNAVLTTSMGKSIKLNL